MQPRLAAHIHLARQQLPEARRGGQLIENMMRAGGHLSSHQNNAL